MLTVVAEEVSKSKRTIDLGYVKADGSPLDNCKMLKKVRQVWLLYNVFILRI